MEQYADIIINRKSAALDRTFTYEVPAHLHGLVSTGSLVQIPFNRETLEGVVIRLHGEKPDAFDARPITDVLSDGPLFSKELLELSVWISRYYLCSRASALLAMLPAGMALSGRPPQYCWQEFFRLAEGWQEANLTPKRQQLAACFQADGVLELTAARLKEAGFTLPFLRAAEKAGILTSEKRRIAAGLEMPVPDQTELSPEQQAVFRSILDEQQGKNRPFLLHGVTGSGKTELYLRLITEHAKAGKQSIVLVPEIALSAQMVDMLSRRLEIPLTVLHSGLTQAERRRIWQEIAEGRYGCVVGPRSAVFAPLPNLGLIIVDESHETSYKQENVPRFHATAVAEKRAALAGASLVLGSATPTVEQYWSAKQGIYALGELTGHYFPAPAPKVEIIDMRKELREGNTSMFSRRLLAALDDVLAGGEQAVLFMNRRGFYQHFACRDCGSSIQCPHCAVAMSYHADAYGGRLKCHYCGRSMRPPARCPVCGSSRIRKFGVGTQRVAEALAKEYPDARILRLDSDSTAKRGAHEEAYRTMKEGRADILIGTQMVVKGLDFPGLTLAVSVMADNLLNLPDWRAAERTYQVLTQLVGRAGRRSKQGLALIQTYLPEALPIRAAAAGDYQQFFQHELEERDLHDYPPFTHLLRILLSANDRDGLEAACRRYAGLLRQTLRGLNAEICGPAEAPLARIKDRWRRQIVVKCKDIEAAGTAAEQARNMLLQEGKLPRDLLFAMDVDPFSVM